MPSSSPAVENLLPRSPIKRSERCPHCNSLRLIKKGARKKKLERVPILRCLSCGRSFTVGPRPIRNKTYPVNEITEGLTLYNRGYSLAETDQSLITLRTARHTLDRLSLDIRTSDADKLQTLRARGRELFKPAHTTRAIKLYHRQVYEFSWHRPKLEFLRKGTLDNRRVGYTKYSARSVILSNPSLSHVRTNIFGARMAHAVPSSHLTFSISVV